MAVNGLHAEQNQRLVGGAEGLERAQRSPRGLQELDRQSSEPGEDAGWPGPAVD